MRILQIIGMVINNEYKLWSPVSTTQKLGNCVALCHYLGSRSRAMSPKSCGPQYCFHSNPENSLAKSLASEKEEIQFLWHSWAKATLPMFTSGRIPLLFC